MADLIAVAFDQPDAANHVLHERTAMGKAQDASISA